MCNAHAFLCHRFAREPARYSDPEWAARRLAEDLALALQASLLSRVSPPEVAEAFCSSRLGGGGRAYGTLPEGIQAEAIVERALS